MKIGRRIARAPKTEHAPERRSLATSPTGNMRPSVFTALGAIPAEQWNAASPEQREQWAAGVR